jgi:hypothetical protein
MKFEMPHELSHGEAMQRMKALTAYWRKKYAVESRWTRDVARMSGSVLGVTFEATLAVSARTVVIDGPDPGFLLRNQVTGYLTRKLDQYLAPEPVPATPPDKGRAHAPAP